MNQLLTHIHKIKIIKIPLNYVQLTRIEPILHCVDELMQT